MAAPQGKPSDFTEASDRIASAGMRAASIQDMLVVLACIVIVASHVFVLVSLRQRGGR